ncbi:protein phosphatase 2C domain-containing protein [Lentibacillus sp. CBA3610]|uniref:protein phosphatase 2C domain-containing protein n=1 Tax=Lentibacillus sp. CBA3610 TaxID=2518176 RepID=UPI0020D1FEEC|nr:protein phosphatase 2C domain-containing protein [Lentibacillus sp. CBA3610]
MRGHFQTDQGQIRDHNEDAGGIFYNQSGQMLAVIADGMGGHQAGDVASQMATSFIQGKWEEADTFDLADTTETWLKENMQEMNRTLLEHAQENEECAGMGTTVVAAVCTETFTAVAHIGDSRCYLLNEDGFRQINGKITHLVNETRSNPAQNQ